MVIGFSKSIYYRTKQIWPLKRLWTHPVNVLACPFCVPICLCMQPTPTLICSHACGCGGEKERKKRKNKEKENAIRGGPNPICQLIGHTRALSYCPYNMSWVWGFADSLDIQGQSEGSSWLSSFLLSLVRSVIWSSAWSIWEDRL